MPVLFADEDGTEVAAAHAGWRGLAGGVLEATVERCAFRGRTSLAWLGPAIGPRAYEVGEDVRAAFARYPGALCPDTAGPLAARPLRGRAREAERPANR